MSILVLSFLVTHCQHSSEGVQVGSVASAAGVVGAWTTSIHDQGVFCSPRLDR